MSKKNVERRLFSEGAVTIEALSQGDGAPYIVLLPSNSRGAEDYEELAALLSDEGYSVIRPQPRGVGQSIGAMDNLTLHDLANDVAMVVRQACVAPVVIAGHAFGNWVARTFATDHPDLVRAVILIAAAGRAPIDPELHALIPRCADMALPAAERLGYLYRAFFAAGSDAKGWLTGWYPLVGNMQRGATSRTPQNDFIRAGVAPILDLQAADDTLVPQEYSQDLKRELGDRVTVQVIARAGHALPVEQPRAVCDAIVTYLDSVDERSALSL